MADKKISALTAGTALANDDIVPFVDISDATDAPSGTTKKITKANLVTDLATALSSSLQPLDADLTAIAGANNGSVLASTTASFTAADESKLDGIEAGADVTDATNVDAAGAVMNTDTSTAAMSFVVDEDDMASDSATKVPTQQSVKAFVEASIPTIGQLNKTHTDGVVSGASSETAFYTVSIPGGTLSTDRVIMGRFRATIATASASTKTIRMKYGTTTLADIDIPGINTTGRSISVYADFYIMGAGSTSAQESSIVLTTNDDSSVNNNADQDFITGGSSSQDSTSTLNLQFTVTQNNTDTFTMHNAYLIKT